MLTIDSNLEYDEAIANDSDDNDVDSLSTALQAAIDALTLNTYSSATGFPQYAEVTDFASSNETVTNWFLASNSSGDGFSTTAGIATDLYFGIYQIYLFGTDDPNVVVGRITDSASGTVALVIALDDSDLGSPNLGVTVYVPLVHDGTDLVDDDDTLDLSNLIYLGSDFDTTQDVPFDNFGKVPSGQDAFAMVAPTQGTADVQLLLTGFTGSTVSTVNVSTTGLGSGAQHVDEGESLRVDLINGADLTKADTSSEVHNSANIAYNDHQEGVTSASFAISQINPTGVVATCTVILYDNVGDAKGASFPTTAISSPGTVVSLDVNDIVILNSSDQDITQDFLDRGGTITLNGNGVQISGLLITEQVKVTPDGATFERMVITNTDATKGPDAFDVGAIKVTVTQGGTDSETTELGSHILFEDQGPSIELSSDTAGASVDESALGSDSGDFSTLFTVDFGPDGEGHIDYALGVSSAGDDSTLVDTASGAGIFLYKDGDDVVGRIGSDATTPDSSGAIAFRIEVDSDGNVMLTQYSAVVHGNPDDDNDSVAMSVGSLVTLTATAYDNEGANSDSDSATADIAALFTFLDDGPSITGHAVPADDQVTVLNTVGSTNSNSFTLDGGADGIGAYIFTGTPDSSGDYRWTYSNAEHTQITETYKGANLFTLDLDSSDGSYTMTMLGTLQGTTDHLDTGDIKAGGPDTNFIDVGLMGSGGFCELSGFSGTNPAAINESHAFVGVSNGNLDNGEAIKFQLFAPDGPDAGTAPDPIYFLGLNIGTKSAQTSTYRIDIDFVDPSKADIVGQLVTVPKNTALSINPAGDDLIQSITVHKESGSALKLGLGQIEILLPPVDSGFTYNVQLNDGDNDHAGSSFTAFIDADGGGITNPVFPA